MRSLWLLNLRRLRQQPLRAAIAIVAVAGGVALTLGVFVARTSVDRSFDSLGRAVTGDATLRVRGPVEYGGLDAAVAGRVAAVDGVAAAVPLVNTVVVATDSEGEDLLVPAFGVDCSVERIVGTFGCDPAALEAVAEAGDVPIVSRRLASRLGERGLVRTNAGVVPIAGAPTSSELDALNDGDVVVWPLATAQRLLTREGRLDQLLIVPEPGTDAAGLRDRVVEAVGHHNVVAGVDGALGGSYVADEILRGLLLTSTMGLLIGVQLVHSTFALAFEERRRELATSAAIGAGPRLVAIGLLSEAAILGVGGGLLGTFGAALVGRAFVDTLATQIGRTAGLRLQVHLTAGFVIAGIAIGVGAAVVAAVRPARAAAKLDLAAELAERDRHAPAPARRRIGLAVALAGTPVGLALGWLGWRDGSIDQWQPQAALLGLVVASSCAFRVPGLLAAEGVELVGRSRLGAWAPVHVAIGGLRGDSRRTASVTNALGSAAALAVTLGAVVPSLSAAAEQLAQDQGSSVNVTTLSLNNSSGIDSKVPPSVAAAIAAMPGVERVDAPRHSVVDHPDVGLVELESGTGAAALYDVHRGDGPRGAFAAGRVMIGPGLARRLDLDVGDPFSVPGVRGPVALVVGGIWANPDGVGANITASPAQFAAIAGDRPPGYLDVVPAAGVATSELAARIRAAGLHDRLFVRDAEQLADELAVEFRAFADPFLALQRAVLIVGFVATLSTLLLAAVQRRRELATLAAVGMPPADLARTTLAEAGILAIVATAIGAAAGVVAFVGWLFASPSVTGLPMAFVLPWHTVPAVGLVVLLVAVGGAAWPAWRTSRLEPALALRYE